MSDKFEQLQKHIEKERELLDAVQGEMKELEEEREEETLGRIQDYDLNESEFKDFFERPYLLVPKEESEWHVIVPSFIPFHVGHFDRREGNFNIFTINKYTRMMGTIPDFIKQEIELPEPKNLKVLDGMLHFDSALKQEVSDDYGYHLGKVKKRTARIKRGHEFDLIAEIIRDGSLPFTPKTVSEEDLRPHEPGEEEVKLSGEYEFHGRTWEEFLENGAIGIFWPTGAGKDIFSVYALDRIRVGDLPNLYLAPNLTILEQVEEEYIPTYAPRLEEELEEGRLILSTYQNYDNIKDEEYGLVVFGECHRLPAQTFSRLSTLNCRYRIGQSASIYREDGRTDLIFTMTGKPLGLDWAGIMKVLGKKYHQVNVHILPNEKAKFERLEELYDPDKRTLVYTWRIKIGKKISKKLGIPFVYGETKDRMKVIRENKSLAISMVGELGISLENLQHIIEVDFLYGSRSGELQKTGRLLHSKKAESHDILFTEEEFQRYKKRLFSLIEKGFKLNFVDLKEELKLGEEISEKKFPELQEKLRRKEPVEVGNKADFLKHPAVRETIDEILEDSRVSPRYVKGTLAMLLKREKADYRTIAKSLGISDTSHISKAVARLEENDIVTKGREEGRVVVGLNDEGLRDVIKLKREREETEKVIESIFGSG